MNLSTVAPSICHPTQLISEPEDIMTIPPADTEQGHRKCKEMSIFVRTMSSKLEPQMNLVILKKYSHLLRSLKIGQVNLTDDVWQPPPLVEAQRAGAFDVTLDEFQELALVGLADQQVATVHGYLPAQFFAAVILDVRQRLFHQLPVGDAPGAL